MATTLDTQDPLAALSQARARRAQIRGERRRLEAQVERLQREARTDDTGDEAADYIERVLRGEPLGNLSAPGARLTGIAEQIAQAKRQLGLIVQAQIKFHPTFEKVEAEAKAHASRQVLDEHRAILSQQASLVVALAALAEREHKLISDLAEQQLYSPGVLPQLSFPGTSNHRGRDSLVSRWLGRLRQHGVEVEA
jgi:hypothetical protein